MYILSNGICTNQNLSLKKRRLKFLEFSDINRLPKKTKLSFNSQKEKKCHLFFTILVYHWVKINKREKIDEYLDLARELKNMWNVKVTEITIVLGLFGAVLKCLEKKPEELEIRWRIETIQARVLLRSSYNTEESPADLWRHAIILIPGKKHQVILVWKSCKENNNSNNNK